jgi:CBS-domain-containing membrane protein
MRFLHIFCKVFQADKRLEQVKSTEIILSVCGIFICLLLLAYLDYFVISQTDRLLFIASMGSSAILIFGISRSSLAQPRNLLGGHLLSAIIGVTVYKLFPELPWLASALAVALSMSVMSATDTLHPPGGSTALIAVMGSDQIHSLGYSFVSYVFTSSSIILLIGLAVNNIPRDQHYPVSWR